MDTVNGKKGHSRATKIANNPKPKLNPHSDPKPHMCPNKENLIPIDEKSNDARSEIESFVNETLSGNAAISAHRHIKIKKKPSLLNIHNNKKGVPTTNNNINDPESREFESISEERKVMYKSRSISDPKLKVNAINNNNSVTAVKEKLHPQKLEKRTSASELLRSIPVSMVIKRKKTGNDEKNSKPMSSTFQVNMEFTLEELKNLPNLATNSLSTSVFYYYVWQVDQIYGSSAVFHVEGGAVKFKKEGFTIDVMISGSLERKYFSPKILKLIFKQHLGGFNHQGHPVISDSDMTVAEYCLNLSPFVSVLPDEPIMESVRLQQKSNSGHDLTPFIQFLIRSKRKNISKDALILDTMKNTESETSEQKFKRTVSRQNSREFKNFFVRTKTDVAIVDNHETIDSPRAPTNLPSSSQYTKQLEDKVRILEMKISQAVQQTHATNILYEELLRRDIRSENSTGCKLSHLFPLDPSDQNYYPNTGKSTSSEPKGSNFEESYCALKRDYETVLEQKGTMATNISILTEQKENMATNISKLTEDNRKLKTLNQDLNEQLLNMLNDHYKLLTLQLSDNSVSTLQKESIPTVGSKNLVDSYSDIFGSPVEVKQTPTLRKIPSRPTHLRQKSASKAIPVKELVVNCPPPANTTARKMTAHKRQASHGARLPSYHRARLDASIAAVGEFTDTFNRLFK